MRAKPDLVVFDMDGVLVDDTESYRDTIIATVRYYTGREVTRELVQDYKNQGGWNDDWLLAQKIARDLGVGVEYAPLVEKFNEFFFGSNGTEGLILRERWLAQAGALERLAGRFQLAIFTGRRRFEAQPTLDRYAPHLRFDPIVCAEHVANLKPAPDGLLKIIELAPGRKLWYVGDNVDDARSARAAGVSFIGIAAKTHLRYQELVQLFRSEGAASVIESINQLESVLPVGGDRQA
ncbi:MAG TPA: HAD family hydrolase [Terriglobia bacterium]|nr:HAD family hydrolase [Terriglobia bacterium]